jgi:hypothetical protein
MPDLDFTGVHSRLGQILRGSSGHTVLWFKAPQDEICLIQSATGWTYFVPHYHSIITEEEGGCDPIGLSG